MNLKNWFQCTNRQQREVKSADDHNACLFYVFINSVTRWHSICSSSWYSYVYSTAAAPKVYHQYPMQKTKIIFYELYNCTTFLTSIASKFSIVIYILNLGYFYFYYFVMLKLIWPSFFHFTLIYWFTYNSTFDNVEFSVYLFTIYNYLFLNTDYIFFTRYFIVHSL